MNMEELLSSIQDILVASNEQNFELQLILRDQMKTEEVLRLSICDEVAVESILVIDDAPCNSDVSSGHDYVVKSLPSVELFEINCSRQLWALRLMIEDIKNASMHHTKIIDSILEMQRELLDLCDNLIEMSLEIGVTFRKKLGSSSVGDDIYLVMDIDEGVLELLEEEENGPFSSPPIA